MNPPLLDAQRFGWACVLGVGLGILYGALRPFGRRHRHLADGLFVAGSFYAWLYLSFAICRGDLRLVYTCGLLVGCVGEEWTIGRLLRPVYGKIWDILAQTFSFCCHPFKKIFHKIRKFCKFSLCNREKMGYNKV